MSQLHWNQMNCVLNPNLDKNNGDFLISQEAPVDFILPSNMSCKVYETIKLTGSSGDTIDLQLKEEIMNFIKINDCTDTGNVTELSNESLTRFLQTPGGITVLYYKNSIIGIMLSIILRCIYDNNSSKAIEDNSSSSLRSLSLLSSYNTFLCVHKDYRNQGLAMIIIRAAMLAAYKEYRINHGYFMTMSPHQPINIKIESWYRPINVNKSRDAGFTLGTFRRKGDIKLLQRIGYFIAKPDVLPIKCTNYNLVKKILSIGKFHLDPTEQEFQMLIKCFDIYTVNDNSLFMLFPMHSLICSTGKRVRNAQLALMIGDVMQHALFIAKEDNYDLLYGWCAGDITVERVQKSKGIITSAVTYLEYYNTAKIIKQNELFVPLF